MLRFLYLLGSGYLAICVAALVLPGAPPLSHGAAALVVPGGGAGATWFSRIKPYCNSVEVAFAQQSSPPPDSPDGLGYSAACYALAGRIEAARAAIERLPARHRSYAAGIVFNVGHPVADAGDDQSAGPIMGLVIEYQPDNYMALYHAGMSEYALGQPELARAHLERFLQLYSSPDGWRSNATEVLSRLGRRP
ncbi:MAG TPA: tetratricopeptide repeat protein [Gemmatimonadales bacterium]|nr:tetratricopeptide repeat protein [Gemmatimonadales bacterium]